MLAVREVFMKTSQIVTFNGYVSAQDLQVLLNKLRARSEGERSDSSVRFQSFESKHTSRQAAGREATLRLSLFRVVRDGPQQQSAQEVEGVVEGIGLINSVPNEPIVTLRYTGQSKRLSGMDGARLQSIANVIIGDATQHISAGDPRGALRSALNQLQATEEFLSIAGYSTVWRHQRRGRRIRLADGTRADVFEVLDPTGKPFARTGGAGRGVVADFSPRGPWAVELSAEAPEAHTENAMHVFKALLVC